MTKSLGVDTPFGNIRGYLGMQQNRPHSQSRIFPCVLLLKGLRIFLLSCLQVLMGNIFRITWSNSEGHPPLGLILFSLSD